MNGVNERNHGVIDRTFEKIRYDYPSMNPEVALAWAVNAKNCLPMNNGFSSFQLVFGRNPNLPVILHDFLPALEGVSTSKSVAEHIKAMHAGRKAFAEVQCDEQTRRAFRHRVRAVEKVFSSGSKVYYKRDGQDRWRGPATVIGNDGSVYFLRHQATLYRVAACRIIDKEQIEEVAAKQIDDEIEKTKVIVADKVNQKVYNEAEDDMEGMTEVEPVVAEPKEIISKVLKPMQKPCPKVGDKIFYKAGENEETEWFEVEVFGKGKSGGRNERYLNIRYTDGSEAGIHIDEYQWRLKESDEISVEKDCRKDDEGDVEEALVVMIPWNEHNLPECCEAKEKEMCGWRDNHTYEEVDDVGQKRISTMWILTEKVIDGQKRVKARLVAKGNQENVKVQVDSPTGCKDSLFVTLAIGSMKRWRPKTSDVKNAFLQGQSINRIVYLEPPKDYKKEGRLWKLRKCVYGLDDAARSWFLEVEKDLKNLNCIQSKVDPCLFYFYDDDELIGIVFLYVDDFLHLGNEIFEEKVIQKIKSIYHIGKSEDGSFSYTGLNIQDTVEGIRIDQKQFIADLDVPIVPNAKKDDAVEEKGKTALRRSVGQANWAARRTRPDVSFDLMELSMKFNNTDINDLRRAKKVINCLKSNELDVFFPRLSNKLKLITFSDASFANLIDGVSSGRGHVIFLADEELRSAPLNWTTNKVKRVVSSTLAAEALSLQECLNTAEYIRYIIVEALKMTTAELPIIAYTDSNNVVKAIHSTSLVSDRKLRIDIGAIKQSILEENVMVKWISAADMLADGLTKKGANVWNLSSVLRDGKIRTLAKGE